MAHFRNMNCVRVRNQCLGVASLPANPARKFAAANGDNRHMDIKDHKGYALGRLGMGTHVSADRCLSRESMTAAIRQAVKGGILWFDSAHNYANGLAESALGEALLSPDTLLLAPRVQTKIGFPDFNLGLDSVVAEAALQKRYPALDGPVQPLLERGGHCLAPRFLRVTLEDSLRRLGPIKPHRVLIHNPETQFCGDNRAKVIAGLLEAFELLETCVSEGTIGGYGLATWRGLCVPPGHPLHIPLEYICRLTQATSGSQHGFRAVMLPLNATMRDAAELPSQPVGDSLLPAILAAYELGLEVQVASPLAQGLEVHDAMGGLSLSRILGEPFISTVFVTMWSPNHLSANIVQARRHRLPS